MVVDNRPGAMGMIGVDRAAKAKPDGYTVVAGSISELAILPASGQKLPFDIDKDFVPRDPGRGSSGAVHLSTRIPSLRHWKNSPRSSRPSAPSGNGSRMRWESRQSEDRARGAWSRARKIPPP